MDIVFNNICRFGNIEEESPPKPIPNVFANKSTTRQEPLPPHEMRCGGGAGERLCGGAVTLTDDIQQAQLIDANQEIGGKRIVLGKEKIEEKKEVQLGRNKLQFQVLEQNILVQNLQIQK